MSVYMPLSHINSMHAVPKAAVAGIAHRVVVERASWRANRGQICTAVHAMGLQGTPFLRYRMMHSALWLPQSDTSRSNKDII